MQQTTQQSQPSEYADVLILGGGLAGLCLALQLQRRNPQLRITVLERRKHPVPEAAFKVGESSVEIAADYFANVLGLRAHLDAAHIRKFGFRFFFAEHNPDLSTCTELGVSQIMPTPSWQIDRGRFENFLAAHVQEHGVTFLAPYIVRDVQLADNDNALHTVLADCRGQTRRFEARWVVDAAGRASVLKRQLQLQKPNAHNINAVWWRVDGHIDPNTLVDDAAWRNRCSPPDRWRSTNHFCGTGYWVWTIPLSSGAHSIGIVADESIHPLTQLDSHSKAMAWLHKHQPSLATLLDKPAHTLKDFAFFRHFSYDCKQVFSTRRWALTGEAGLFADPFYSPGSDFIAISNSFISNLICMDMQQQSFAPFVAVYQALYDGFYSNTMRLYQDQYALFGDDTVMPLKVIWDYSYYWGLLAPLVMSQRLTHLPTLSQLRPLMQTAACLNDAMQVFFRAWGARNRAAGCSISARTQMLDQFKIDWFCQMNAQLHTPLEDAAFIAKIDANVQRLRGLLHTLLARAQQQHPDWHAPLDSTDSALAAALDGKQLPAPLPTHW